MKTIPLYQVDAFTKERFKGNPAAVCILDDAIDEKQMRLIAKEMNLSETAFVQSLEGKPIKETSIFSLRWFTPEFEVDLCGHATIATSEVLFSHVGVDCEEISYETKSGRLTAQKIDSGIALNFPLDEPLRFDLSEDILVAMGIRNYETAIIGKNSRKLVIHLRDEGDVRGLRPDFQKMKQLNFYTEVKGIGVTCRGSKPHDFVSRYFNPWAGVDEDPVTGSVHTLLASYWGRILNKNNMKAYQASERGGELQLNILKDNKVEIIGKAIIILKGELYLS